MRIGILGPLDVAADGTPVEVGGARLRALLTRLALDAGRVVTAEALEQALWPDGGPADHTNALQSLVSRLRRTVPGSFPLRSVPGGYRLELPVEDVDLLRFEQLTRAGRGALQRDEPHRALDCLRAALALWRGDPLADLADSGYTQAALARLGEQRLTALEDLFQATLATAPRRAHLVAELEELVAAHPLRERFRALLVRALHANGRGAEALEAYAQARTRLADELGADPGPELQAAHRTALRGIDPAGPETGRQGNLRTALTSFVERHAEQDRIDRQLTEGRLVTLVGPGGSGKTRLATTVGARRADRHPGGVWLVELAAVSDPADVPLAVATTLGLRDSVLVDAGVGPRAIDDRLAERLAPAETLLVLDNCEHLVDAAARLAEELLGRCPTLRVLATSREPLGVGGEALCPVPPLPVPAAAATVAVAVAAPAVVLFRDRVTAVRPDFAVEEENVAAVIEVCRRLDGLPLAIELAAARLRSMSVDQLAARLGDRFRLLTGGSRTALPRHRTLRAVVGWSWDLLDAAERELAEWLSVFPGTITPHSAAGAGTEQDAPPAVLDLLAALVDKSLLHVVDDAEPRYRMLETIREYGLDQLAEQGRIGLVRARHAGYFADLAARAEPHLRGAEQVGWLRRLTLERDNLTAALQFAIGTGAADLAVPLGAALSLHWAMRGRHAEAIGALRSVLALPGTAPAGARQRAVAGYLLNTVLSGGYASGDAIGVAVEDLSGPDTHPMAALAAPAYALIADDTRRGLAAIDERMAHRDPWAVAMLRLLRAFLRANHGDTVGRRRDLVAAAAGFRGAGDRWGLSVALTWLADVQTTHGQFGGAIESLDESVRLLRELDPDDEVVLQRVWLAVARYQQGDRDRARAELTGLLARGANATSARYLVFARISRGDLARYDGDLTEAAVQYGAAARELGRVSSPAPLFDAMLCNANAQLALDAGRTEAAGGLVAEAYQLATGSADMPLVAMVCVAVARLRLAEGAATTAAQILGAGHALRGAPDAYNPDVVRLLARLDEALGEGRPAAYERGSCLGREAALHLLREQLDRG